MGKTGVMLDDATLAELERRADEANPSYWIPKLIAEIRRSRSKTPCVMCGIELPGCMHREHSAMAHGIHEMA